jgi:hypothetical protein
MTLHFHVGHVPITLTIGKDQAQEEIEVALALYGLALPREGRLARDVLRKQAARR